MLMCGFQGLHTLKDFLTGDLQTFVLSCALFPLPSVV